MTLVNHSHLNFIEEKVGNILHPIGTRKDFLINTGIKANNWQTVKLKRFCITKDTIFWVKRLSTEWGESLSYVEHKKKYFESTISEICCVLSAAVSPLKTLKFLFMHLPSSKTLFKCYIAETVLKFIEECFVLFQFAICSLLPPLIKIYKILLAKAK